MQLVPIPVTDEHISRTAAHWFPFLRDIAKRSKEPVSVLLGDVTRKDVQPILIWDEEEARAVALLGVRYVRRGDDLIAEIVWTTGKGRDRWQGLLPQLEDYVKNHVGCVAIRSIARLGWAPLLKSHGYKATHITMEKVL